MRIWCLTSLTLKPYDNPKNVDLYIFQGIKDSSFDHYNCAKQSLISTHLSNAKHYVLSEIRIGKKGNQFYFVLCRQGVKCFNIMMTKGSLKALPRLNAESPVIDILVDNEKIVLAEFPEKYIEKIRIRAIKNTSVKRIISFEEEKKYTEYANLINEYAEEDIDKQEKAFRKYGPLKLPNECLQKRLEQKITDLYNVINDLCHPETGDIKNVLETARYYSGLYDYEVLRFKPGNYDAKYEKSKDFKGCRSLLYDSVKLNSINERWFLAKELLSLTFKNTKVFTLDSSWEIFGNNIGKLQRLSHLELNDCQIKEIPEFVFKNLPESIETLFLPNNNLTEISPYISKLKKLHVLILNNNRNLTDGGIPWGDLPKDLWSLELRNTKITKIPPEMKELQNLRVLDVQCQSLKELEWSDITKGIEKLSISNSNILQHIDIFRRKLNAFVLNNTKVKYGSTLQVPIDVREVKITNCQMEICNFFFGLLPFAQLTIFNLSNNNIKSVPWDELPRTLKVIDFSFNALTEVGTVKHLINLEELHLRNNLIENITAGFEQFKKIRIINLRNNKLSKLPVGFELISSRLLRLNLSGNQFNYENDDLNESLWNRLPPTFTLNLNKNPLFQLPCQIAGKIRELQAMDCKLQYICPQIYNKLFECIYDTYYLGLQRMQLNVAMNDKLKTFSFIPHTIYSKASPKEKPTDNLLPYLTSDEERKYIASKKYPEWSIIISDKETLRNTQRFPKMGKKLVYAFKIVEETKNEQEKFCKCCAYCKHEEANNEKTYMIEQFMMMDCFFSVVDETSLARNVNIFGQAGWPAGKWKALIRTRLCEACINQLKTKAEEAQNNCYETSNKIEAKKQRSSELKQHYRLL